MLDLSFDRTGTEPRDAATLLLIRDTDAGPAVFCVERNKKSRFLGGAIVFPGGKLEESDSAPEWQAVCEGAEERELAAGFAKDATHLLALRVAACRESLEEAAILPVADGALDAAGVLALRARVEGGADLRTELSTLGLRLAVSRVVSFARWVTPAAEARRFDARFFLCKAPAGQPGAHDEHETMASFWATPKELLGRFSRREVALAPPTHRTLELLSAFSTADLALAWARTTSLAPICPELKPHEDARGKTMALVLPGDPEHQLREARVPGRSRYVLRDEQWLAEEPPT